MANNKIQIKRSTLNATIPALSNGELAFTQAGNTLHIGLPDGSANIRIGGYMNPGFLTNNHALVANTTGGIDKVIVANASISQLNANGATGTAGHVLKSGGAGSNSYWEAPASSVAGSNTQVQFNDNGSLAGDSGLTFNKTTDTLYTNSLTTTGDVTINGNTKLGDATSDVASINARVNTAIVPTANITYDLGTNDLRWKNLYSSHVESTSGTIGNIEVSGNVVVGGSLNLNLNYEIFSNTKAANTSNTQTIITSFPANLYRGGKFMIIGKRSNDSHITELLLTHNASNVSYTEYGVLCTNNELYTVSSIIASGNVQIILTSSFSDVSYEIVENKFKNQLQLYDRSINIIFDRSGSIIETRAA